VRVSRANARRVPSMRTLRGMHCDCVRDALKHETCIWCPAPPALSRVRLPRGIFRRDQLKDGFDIGTASDVNRRIHVQFKQAGPAPTPPGRQWISPNDLHPEYLFLFAPIHQLLLSPFGGITSGNAPFALRPARRHQLSAGKSHHSLSKQIGIPRLGQKLQRDRATWCSPNS
jgi:hypothetical protein